MKLKFVCPNDFRTAEEISRKIQNYFPNLIEATEIIHTKAFDSVILQTGDVERELEQVANPNWEKDIIINVINGLVNYQNLEINVHAYTLNTYTRKTLPVLFKIKRLKKGGHIILGNLVEDELTEDIDYLAKLGAEQFHKMLGILPHNENCFSFFSSKYGVLLEEDLKKDFCPQCKKFVAKLKEPLDHREISRLKEKIYPNARKRYWEFVRLKYKRVYG